MGSIYRPGDVLPSSAGGSLDHLWMFIVQLYDGPGEIWDTDVATLEVYGETLEATFNSIMNVFNGFGYKGEILVLDADQRFPAYATITFRKGIRIPTLRCDYKRIREHLCQPLYSPFHNPSYGS